MKHRKLPTEPATDPSIPTSTFTTTPTTVTVSDEKNPDPIATTA
jgi:hypothetical protein